MNFLRPKKAPPKNNNKKPLPMSFTPTAKGLIIIGIRSEYRSEHFVAQLLGNHSLTLKPPDYKNNGSYATVINLLSKDFLKCRNPA